MDLRLFAMTQINMIIQQYIEQTKLKESIR
jgi:hypothetical protein